MKRLTRIVVVSLAVALTVFGCGRYSASQGWVTLIDGEKGLENFNRIGDANWHAADGAIQADKSTTKGASVLVSKRSFKDFELVAEFWAGEDTNSGVYFRAPDPNLVSTATGAYEAQIWDKNPNAAYSSGSLVNVAAVSGAIYKVGGRWNVYEIHAKGPQITVKLNGVITANVEHSKSLEGRIALQFNGGPIKFRKLIVKPL
jgi:hypothetical protein